MKIRIVFVQMKLMKCEVLLSEIEVDFVILGQR